MGVTFPRNLLLISSFFLTTSTYAESDLFRPNIGLTETYVNNIELSPLDEKSSLVSQLIFGLNSEYVSKKVQFSLTGTQTQIYYSHDKEMNDDYQELLASGLYNLWQDKLQIIGNSSITNVSKNDTENSLPDVIHGDTIQQRKHFAGLQFNSNNSTHNLNASLLYTIVDTEDDIGESNTGTITINSSNGYAARNVFWLVKGSFSNQRNDGFTSENYKLETKIGAITSYRLNPFIRLYNERVSGNLAGSNPNTIPSWGPGFRYLVSKHFTLDLSYNYVRDDTEASEDYLAASVDWQPSKQTSLRAGYSKRFFGESYELDVFHKTKRLSNKISYIESIEAFDRNDYNNTSSFVMCKYDVFNVADCLQIGETPNNTTNYIRVPVTLLELTENNEFTLNKRFVWNTELSFARTDFSFDISNREREALSTGVIDRYFDTRFSVTRKVSGNSRVTSYVSFVRNVFDKDKSGGPRQKDTYTIFSATYNQTISFYLDSFVTLQYIDRESTIAAYTYDEFRASINLTKHF